MPDTTRTQPALAAVDLPDLADWLPRQRWFGGKGRAIAGVRPVDVLRLPDGPGGPVWLTPVAVAHADGGAAERWLLVLAAAEDADADDDVLGRVEDVPVVELSARPAAARALLSAVAAGGRLASARGEHATARTWGPGLSAVLGPRTRVRAVGVEQSNTSLVVGDPHADAAVVVKVIRRLEAGPNPDVEVTAALTESGFRGVPALLGALTGPADEALISASAFVAEARDASDLAAAEAGGRADHGVGEGMADLGRLTADLHARLREVLPTAPAGADDVAAWARALRSEADATSAVLRERRPGAVAAVTAAVEAVLADLPPAAGRLQRIHGDLHLGQVLLQPDGSWWILDFEGEPARPVAERRAPGHVAKDVAGLLRSLDYARARAERTGGDPAAAARWAAAAREDLLAGYEAGARAAGASDAEVEAALRWVPALEVEKLLYEIRYEAANRPEWLDIPLGALTRDVAGQVAGGGEAPAATAASPAPEVIDVTDPPAPAPSTEDQVAVLAEVLAEGRAGDPHRLLGYHALPGGGWAVRAWRPGAHRVGYLATPDGEPRWAGEVRPGLFQVEVADEPRVGRYRIRVDYGPGGTFDLVDPYAFPPALGEVDLHLLVEGRHEQAWTVLGANRRELAGIGGVGFAVWAPNARSVRVVGEFNSWDGRLHPMRALGSSGIWELFVPDVPDGTRYKFEVVTADGSLVTRADPWAKWAEEAPGTSSRVFTSTFTPRHAEVARRDPHSSPMSVYEVHLGSWRHRDGRPLTYAELAEDLAGHVEHLGFTHVELLPPAEHPFGGSWGYQVTGHFAPTARFGDPDDFRRLVDALHARGIGVIVDWVPAHFPKDEWALARFDGTALYEHEDPRQGEHPDWGTLVFNYGRREVRNFLVASALFWIEEMGVDGLRVDAVASMLYLDYSRQAGQWVPNEHGGRENLRAVELLQEVNATVYKRNPHAFTIAEESTAWPGVTRPTHLGGLGFGFKWNMGWMHDTLGYFSKDPLYRRWHHNQLTFGLMYAFSENFVLPLSHDEVVHGKGSLIGKMPGDRWQRFANLRALYGWMWAHPGKQLLFMGQELAQEREWSEVRELDWWLLEDPHHAGVQRLVSDLNRAYRALPALWRRDSDPGGFGWIDANNADDNVLSFLRHGGEGDPDVALVANLSATPRRIRIGLSRSGHWAEALNTDAEAYGGSNVGNYGGVDAVDEPWHGRPASAEVTCPPLGVVWLRGPEPA